MSAGVGRDDGGVVAAGVAGRDDGVELVLTRLLRLLLTGCVRGVLVMETSSSMGVLDLDLREDFLTSTDLPALDLRLLVVLTLLTGVMMSPGLK